MSVGALAKIAVSRTVAGRRWLIPLTAIFGWAALTGIFSLSFFSALDSSRAELVTANDFLLTLDDMLSAAQDAETGQRGYLITKNLAYLEPYHKGIAAGEATLNRLAGMHTSRPEQLDQLKTIRSLWNQKAGELASTVKMVAENRADEARRTLSDDRGKSIMDQLRVVVGDLRAAEVEARHTVVGEQKTRVWRLLFFTQATTLLGLCALLYFLYRSQSAQQALRVEVANRQSAEELAEERAKQAGRMRVMNRELVHRTKNLISVVQAIVRNQQRGSPEIDHYALGLSNRLVSLGSTLDILIRENWHQVTLKDLIDGQLAHFAEDMIRRIVVKAGPAIRFSPSEAQMVGLAIHELGTNAAKYGALSSDSGRVDISWTETPGPQGSDVRLSWTERGGPTVAQPTRHGFGSRILEQLVARAVEGKVTINFAPGGLVWVLDFSRHARPYMGEEAALAAAH